MQLDIYFSYRIDEYTKNFNDFDETIFFKLYFNRDLETITQEAYIETHQVQLLQEKQKKEEEYVNPNPNPKIIRKSNLFMRKRKQENKKKVNKLSIFQMKKRTRLKNFQSFKSYKVKFLSKRCKLKKKRKKKKKKKKKIKGCK